MRKVKKSCVTEETAKPSIKAKIEFSKLRHLSDEEILKILQGSYPGYQFRNISSSWRNNFKDDLIAEGQDVDIILRDSG